MKMKAGAETFRFIKIPAPKFADNITDWYQLELRREHGGSLSGQEFWISLAISETVKPLMEDVRLFDEGYYSISSAFGETELVHWD